jgi:hypothetical protein
MKIIKSSRGYKYQILYEFIIPIVCYNYRIIDNLSADAFASSLLVNTSNVMV